MLASYKQCGVLNKIHIIMLDFLFCVLPGTELIRQYKEALMIPDQNITCIAEEILEFFHCLFSFIFGPYLSSLCIGLLLA